MFDIAIATDLIYLTFQVCLIKIKFPILAELDEHDIPIIPDLHNMTGIPDMSDMLVYMACKINTMCLRLGYGYT